MDAHVMVPKRKTFVGLRVGASGLDAIDQLAADLRLSRSQVMRLFLTLGHQRWQAMTPGQREAALDQYV